MNKVLQEHNVSLAIFFVKDINLILRNTRSPVLQKYKELCCSKPKTPENSLRFRAIKESHDFLQKIGKHDHFLKRNVHFNWSTDTSEKTKNQRRLPDPKPKEPIEPQEWRKASNFSFRFHVYFRESFSRETLKGNKLSKMKMIQRAYHEKREKLKRKKESQGETSLVLQVTEKEEEMGYFGFFHGLASLKADSKGEKAIEAFSRDSSLDEVVLLLSKSDQEPQKQKEKSDYFEGWIHQTGMSGKEPQKCTSNFRLFRNQQTEALQRHQRQPKPPGSSMRVKKNKGNEFYLSITTMTMPSSFLIKKQRHQTASSVHETQKRNEKILSTEILHEEFLKRETLNDSGFKKIKALERFGRTRDDLREKTTPFEMRMGLASMKVEAESRGNQRAKRTMVTSKTTMNFFGNIQEQIRHEEEKAKRVQAESHVDQKRLKTAESFGSSQGKRANGDRVKVVRNASKKGLDKRKAGFIGAEVKRSVKSTTRMGFGSNQMHLGPGSGKMEPNFLQSNGFLHLNTRGKFHKFIDSKNHQTLF